MAVTLPVLAWVFYTTSSGMIDIMQKEPGDIVGIVGTLVATTAILVMLASTSWSLGADLAALIARRRMARERMLVKTLVTAAVFVFVFSISAFFSFTYYYNNIFKLSSRKIVAELQPMELAANVVLPATKQINAAYEAASARMVADPSFRSYLESLDALIDTARAAGPALREAIRKNQEAQQAILAKAAQQVAAELESAQTASRQYDEARAEMTTLEKTVASLDAIIKSKQEEITALNATARQEEQLAVDAEHGLDNRGAVCGPNCRTHRIKAEEANRRAAAIRQTLAGPMNERASALRKRDALAAQSIALKQKAELAGVAARKPVPKGEAALDLDATLRDLTALRDQLRVEPTWAKAREIRPLCEPILAAARQSNALPASVAHDFACEPQGAARDLLSARDETIAARAAFDAKCSLDGGLRDELNAIVAKIRAAPASDRSAAANGFNAAKGLVDACVVAGKSVGLSDEDVRELLKKSDAYLRAHSTERNKFELAREAFWSFTPDLDHGDRRRHGAGRLPVHHEVPVGNLQTRLRGARAAPVHDADGSDRRRGGAGRSPRHENHAARRAAGSRRHERNRSPGRLAASARAQCARQSRRHSQPAGARRDRPCRPPRRLCGGQCHHLAGRGPALRGDEAPRPRGAFGSR
ncbi:hypothetical protein WOB59_05645 [Methylocystis sp. IM4]|uniref:hypothetical protein n=1 Tax=Methylocystis sp. IM4 TaxID=3136560 RepID=UPI003119CEE6